MNPFEGGSPENKDGYGSIRDPFSAADDSRSKAESDKVLNNGPEIGIVLAGGAPGAGEFRSGSGAPEVKMENGQESSPDGSRSNVDEGDFVEAEYVGDVDDEKQENDKEGEKTEKQENNYTWEEFASRVRTIIDYDRINDNNRQAVDDLESVGIHIRIIMDSDDNKDFHERNRGLRNALDVILVKIDEKRILSVDDFDFLVGMGVSEDKINEWTNGVSSKDKVKPKDTKNGSQNNNKNDKQNMNNEQKTETETEEKTKKDSARQARLALTRLINGRTLDQAKESDGPLFDAWVNTHVAHADGADYDEAVRWRNAIENKKQEKIQEEEQKRQEVVRQQKVKEDRLERVQKEKEEREKRERADALAAEKAEREKEKREKQQRARDELADIISDQPESDEAFEKVLQNWVRNYGKDAPGELKVANRYLGEIYNRRAIAKAEKDAVLTTEKASKEAVRQAAVEKNETISLLNSRYNKFVTELNAKPKLIPSSKEKKAWFERLAYFISYYDNEYFGHIQEVADKVAMARALEKEEKVKELTTGDNVEGWFGDILNGPGNLVNKLTGGRLYKRRPYIKK